MRIVHLSDLHFGSQDPGVVEAVRDYICANVPDLIIVSGDLTQSATDSEFAQTAAFFASLPVQILSIPGNHDLPGIDIRRFFDPFRRYRRHISEVLEPEYETDLIHIKGLNSARMLLPGTNWAHGSISRKQAAQTEALFRDSKARWKLLFVHHPLTNTAEFPLDVTVFHADRLLSAIRRAEIDFVLAGHQHHASVEVRDDGVHTTLFVSASTGTSDRLRRQPNGFNVLTFTGTTARVDRMEFEQGHFHIHSAQTHTKA